MMKPGEMSGAELLDIIAGVPTLERNQAKAELLARLNAGGSPDFKTVNSAIEALTDSAQLLREKEGSAGFDASVVLIIERAIQALKSVESEGASQPLQARPICPRCQDLNIDMEFCNDGFVKAQCRNCHHAASTHGNLHEFFSAPPAMPAPLEHIFAGRFDESWTREQEDELLAKMLARRASPQLEQVAREIAEHVFGCSSAIGQVAEFAQEILAILQRHFPGSEGKQCKDPGCKCAAHRIPENENQAASPPVAAAEGDAGV